MKILLILALSLTGAFASAAAKTPVAKKAKPAAAAKKSKEVVTATLQVERGDHHHPGRTSYRLIKLDDGKNTILERTTANGRTQRKKLVTGAAAVIRADLVSLIWDIQFRTPAKPGPCETFARLDAQTPNDRTVVCGHQRSDVKKVGRIADHLDDLF